MRLLAIARRELLSALRSPAAHLVAAAFLALLGGSFWLALSVGNGALTAGGALRLACGGSLAYWIAQAALASLLTMRAIADERRAGTLEPLMATPVSGLEVAAGKLLGALGFYSLIWLPTVGHALLLSRLAPGIGAGSAIGCYLGALLIGASALGVGLLASALSAHQLGAAGLSFAILVSLLLAGSAGPALPADSALKPLLDHLDLRRELDLHARGIFELRAALLHLSIGGLSLHAAARILDAPAAPAARVRRFAVEGLAACALAIALNLAVSGSARRIEIGGPTSARLDPRTAEILARLDRPVEVTVLLPPSGSPADPGAAVRELLELYRARSTRLRVDWIGEAEGGRAGALGRRLGLDAAAIADGMVVFESGGRHRIVSRGELVRVEVDRGAPRIVAVLAEGAFDAALLAVASDRRPRICFTTGHGEGAIDSLAVDGLSGLADALRSDGAEPRTLAPGATPECDAIVIAGAERPFAGAEVAVVERTLASGGGLLVLAPNAAANAPPPSLGLEALLARCGAGFGDAGVVDPAHRLGGQDLWAIDRGYADHPITRGLLGRRTVWAPAREIRPVSRAGVRAQALAWREALEGEDSPKTVAAAASCELGPGEPARLVVLGDGGLARNDRDVSYNRDLVVSALGWLSRRGGLALPAPPGDEPMRLDDRELDRVFAVCVVGIPLAWLMLGFGVWWLRRR